MAMTVQPLPTLECRACVNKTLAILRNKFGGHAVQEKK